MFLKQTRYATKAFQFHLFSHLSGGGCPVVVSQWQSIGSTSQVSWVHIPGDCRPFHFPLFHFKQILFNYQLVQGALNAYKPSQLLYLWYSNHFYLSFHSAQWPVYLTVQLSIGYLYISTKQLMVET